MRNKAIRLVLGALLLVVTPVLLAHHGSAGYDRQKAITLTGVITSVEWVNPHSFIYIDVRNDKGEVENWALEGIAPNPLLHGSYGWKKEMLAPGMKITAIGAPARAAYPAGVGTFRSLSDALAYSPGAIDHLKASRILQAGEIRIAGQDRVFGMGPRFSSK